MVGELFLQPQQPSFIARLHELMHERRGGDEAHRQPPLARGQSQSLGHVSRPGAARSQSDDVLAPLDSFTSGELEHLDLAECRDRFELEAVQTLDGGKLRRPDAPLDQAPFAVDELEFDQTREDVMRCSASRARTARRCPTIVVSDPRSPSAWRTFRALTGRPDATSESIASSTSFKVTPRWGMGASVALGGGVSLLVSA